MTRVLVTGASGFIGRHAVEELRRLGVETHTVSSHAWVEAPNGTHHVADLLEEQSGDELIQRLRPSHILHVAWYAVPGQYWNSHENVRWLAASVRLARSFWSHGGRRLLAVGTCAQYEWSHEQYHELTTPTAARTLYGQCKQALESELHSMAASAGCGFASGRLFFPYGPHERPERLVPSVIRSLHRGEPAVCSVGTQRRDFIHVSDVGASLTALLLSDLQGPFNIASGIGTSVRELATRIGARMGREELLRFERPVPSGDPPVLIADVRRLTEELRWRPSFDLDAGLEDAIGWWRRELAR